MYTINEDGTVTRKGGSYNGNSPKPTGDSNDNSGCWVLVIITVIIGVIVIALSNKNENSSNHDTSVGPGKVKTYLNVSPSSLSFASSGGSQTLRVETNSNWSVSVNTDNWGHLIRTGNQLTVKVDANNSSTSRTDYFCIKSDGIERRVNITQEGISSNYSSSNVSGAVRNIWVDYNVSDSYGNKGMNIHIKFDINGMLNKRGQAAVYFYYTNGNPLKDTNGRCCTSNGDVATHVDFIPNYENCTFNDLSIFIPYSELHLSKSASCFFTISIWKGNKELTQSEKFYFDVTC